jgi:hypothetical protein
MFALTDFCALYCLDVLGGRFRGRRRDRVCGALLGASTAC